jgi:DNA-binding Xre family transcriptional regulator
MAKGARTIISYAPLWETMKAKKITTYTLIQKYKFSKGTLDSLKHDRNVTTATLDDLCRLLDCRLDEIAMYIPDANE